MSSAPAIWRQSKSVKKLLGKRGKIITFSVVRTAPAGFERLAPYTKSSSAYVVGIVELKDGKRVTTQIVGWEAKEIRLGAEVQAVFRRLDEPTPSGVIKYGIKFRLV